MGFNKIRLLGLCSYLLCLSFFIVVNAVNKERSRIGVGTEKGFVFIHGKSFIGKIDDDFVCATLDWWPPQKCDYGRCSWGLASLLNLVYFRAKVIFGLNALAGKSLQTGSAVGPWNYTNAESFIRYTVKKNYVIHGWELDGMFVLFSVFIEALEDYFFHGSSIFTLHVTMESVRGVNVPMYTTLRRTTVVFTMLVEFVLVRQRYTSSVIFRSNGRRAKSGSWKHKSGIK
ncbi:hypothetical protein RIF29_19833 [Crotalaria pallida]|uniref:Uncharacterized protein n=1 Tax=Crotalaria pallida TaxID=3830 RepID=A0AAN9F1Y5_CROPI